MRLWLLVLALLAGPAFAQFEIGSGTLPANNTPDTAMPAGKIYVDTETIPAKQSARPTKRARPTCTGVYFTAPCEDDLIEVPRRYAYDGTPGGFDDNNGGSFRVFCDFSHMTFDDPIVWPGQAGRTHLHQFFGNNTTRAASDLDAMATSGDSTCRGGTLNRSGYWSPVVIYHCPAGENAIYGCTEARDGEVIRPTSSNFYYKRTGKHSSSGGFGGTPVVWPPPGFRMIQGRAANTAPMSGANLQIHCTGAGGDAGFDHFPTTAEIAAATGSPGVNCTDIKMRVSFFECWEGSDISGGPFHDDHVEEFNSTTGCSASFPVLFPSITANFHVVIPLADMPYVRLSSDLPRAEAAALPASACTSATNYCAGRSLHADWVNGWDETPQDGTGGTYDWNGLTITGLIIKECYMVGAPETLSVGVSPIHSDCHNHLLGAPYGNGTTMDGGGGSLVWWELY